MFLVFSVISQFDINEVKRGPGIRKILVILPVYEIDLLRVKDHDKLCDHDKL